MLPKLRLGWVPDTPDHRDRIYTGIIAHLPKQIDLRAQCPAIYDQGMLGSCTANAIAAALEFEQIKQKKKPFTPSRLFIYYQERVLENTINSDCGAMIRDGIKVVNKIGAPFETDWPYLIKKFAQKPSDKAYADAKFGRALTYERVPQNLTSLKSILSAGYPIVFGFAVYESFLSDLVTKTGTANMPGKREAMLGGHACLIVGFNDTSGRFIIRNSWGMNWGAKGYFTLPYAYLTNNNLSDDFWAIKLVA